MKAHNKIIDEFTDLPMSRQQKWMLRKIKEGKCPVCGVKTNTYHCEKHTQLDNQKSKRYHEANREMINMKERLRRQKLNQFNGEFKEFENALLIKS